MPESALLASLLMGQKKKADPLEGRRKYGENLIVQGSSTAPVQSPLEGLARALQAGVGGYFAGQAEREDEARGKKTVGALSKALQSKTPEEAATALQEAGTDSDTLAPLLGQLLTGKMERQQKNALATNAYTAAGGTIPGTTPAGGGSAPITQTPLAAPAPGVIPDAAKQKAQQHVNYLVNVHGFTPEQASQMVGNLFQESSLDPANGFDPGKPGGDGGTAAGMGQWRLDRRDALVREAQSRGEDPTNPTTQLDFYANEFKTRPEFQQFQNAKTPEERQAALMTYFRPAGYTPQNPQGGDGYANRINYGQQIGTPPQGGQQPLTINMPQGSADGALPPVQQAQAAPQPQAPKPPQVAPAAAELSRQAQAAFQAGDPARAAQLQQKAQEAQAAYTGEIAKEQRARETHDYNEAQKRKQPPEAFKKLSAELGNLSTAIDNFQTVINEAGGGSLSALIGNPKDPKAQRVLGAYEAMKAALRSEAFLNTGVLQPGENKMIEEMLLSPQSIKGFLANPEAYKAKLDEFKRFINGKATAAYKAYGLDMPPDGQIGPTPAPAAVRYVGTDGREVSMADIEETARNRGMDPQAVIERLKLRPVR